jgi:hypothetical protein
VTYSLVEITINYFAEKLPMRQKIDHSRMLDTRAADAKVSDSCNGDTHLCIYIATDG